MPSQFTPDFYKRFYVSPRTRVTTKQEMHRRASAVAAIVRALDLNVARILDVPVALRGFSAPDVTLAGFGLSRWGEFRDLPHVATVLAEDV